MTKFFYTVKEAADLFDTCAETVRRWIRAGELNADVPNARKNGNKISALDIRRFCETHPKYFNLLDSKLKIRNNKEDENAIIINANYIWARKLYKESGESGLTFTEFLYSKRLELNEMVGIKRAEILRLETEMAEIMGDSEKLSYLIDHHLSTRCVANHFDPDIIFE